MKALIVDDEKHVREAIKILVDWKRYQVHTVLEAANGIQAKELISMENPEFIFTDMMMPLMNGMDLLEWIHWHAPRSKTIVISGHDDFHFVRHTMKFGGMDYLLKPIDPQQLEETFRTAVENWVEEEQLRNRQQARVMEINQIKQVYWDKVFSNMIQDPKVYDSMSNQLESEFGFSHTREQGMIAILNIDMMSQSLRNKYSNNMDMLFYTLANIANEYLREARMGYAFRFWGTSNELLVIFWDNHDAAYDVLMRINDGIKQVLRELFHIGIGTMKSLPSELMNSYMEARSVLKQRNLMSEGIWVHKYASHEAVKVPAISFDSFKANIQTAVRSNNTEQIRASITDWIASLLQLPHISTEELELWWHEYTSLKMGLLKGIKPQSLPDTLASQSFAIPLDERGRLKLHHWRDQFTQEMLTISALLFNHLEKENNTVFNIAEYIEQHYQEDITLKHLSDRFFLSREYISRKFKQQFQKNISEFIESIRIEKAKLLLLNPQYKMVQISQMIGYQDEKYFSKVFKKAVGKSPNQYRNENNLRR
ncbi:response regulator [Paenibacillus paeoniae]|uniref:Response regulator n=1 Tax=Paenibacillus paeoniae TaxID=2292705 RepID=A0A371PFU4_9BACL|nr:response regulator [Paenibacillus paeoniae]REK74782.1 response regulator [Paenibacillus paeoniae]